MKTQTKLRLCKCGNKFEPIYRNGILASRICIDCLAKKAKENRRRQNKREIIILKNRLKTRSELLNDLQKVFNSFIRERDKNKPCISCGKPLRGKYDAGHYFSVGAYPNLRFHEDNVHGQCVSCNQHKHGNIHEYTINLPERIGKERFDQLYELRKKPLFLLTSDIENVIKLYKLEKRELLKADH